MSVERCVLHSSFCIFPPGTLLIMVFLLLACLFIGFIDVTSAHDTAEPITSKPDPR